MTKTELDEKVKNINQDGKASPEEKARRIGVVNAAYANAQKVADDAVKAKRTAAEENLKATLKAAYLSAPAATPEDFERDYASLRSDYLRSTALEENKAALASQARTTRDTF